MAVNIFYKEILEKFYHYPNSKKKIKDFTYENIKKECNFPDPHLNIFDDHRVCMYNYLIPEIKEDIIILLTLNCDDLKKAIAITQIDFTKIPLNIIEKYDYMITFFWDLSKNLNLNKEFLLKHIDKDWDYWTLSNNKNLPLEFIENKIKEGIFFNFEALSYNNNLTQNFIEKYSHENWDQDVICKRFP